MSFFFLLISFLMFSTSLVVSSRLFLSFSAIEKGAVSANLSMRSRSLSKTWLARFTKTRARYSIIEVFSSFSGDASL